MADKRYALRFKLVDGSEQELVFTVPQGESGPQGPQGAPGEPGKTPVKGVDYFTQADRQEIAQQAAQLVEIPHVPEHVSAFENDAGYQTAADVKAIVDRELGVIENGAY